MSTAVLPDLAVQDDARMRGADAVVRIPGGASDRRIIRRRGNREQGRALEILGHSVEYLVDSRMFLTDEVEAKSDREAVQLLMRMSRGVFAECAEVITIERRMKRAYWKVVRKLTGHDRRV